MNLGKPGIRTLAIAESFFPGETSTLVGLVMRKDFRIDGFAATTITVGGKDATEGVIRLYEELDRTDINILMLSGAVIAWFNIIDPETISRVTGLPVICVTYEDSEGLVPHISHHFPGDTERLAAYFHLGERTPVLLRNGYTLYLRSWNIPHHDAAAFCRQVTYDGRIPEPVRAARLLARGVIRYGNRGI